MKAVIEVGANRGTDTQRLQVEHRCNVLSFEPVPELFTMLSEAFASNPNIEMIHGAVDIENGPADFHITATHPKIKARYGASSLFNFKDDLKEKWNRADFEMVKTIKVNRYRLDTFIDLKGITDIPYLHCDAQGNDLNVLKSLGEYKTIVRAGVIEAANKINLYEGSNNDRLECEDWLRSNGFVIVREKMNDPLEAEVNIYFERA